MAVPGPSSKIVATILLAFEGLSFHPNAKTLIRETQLKWDNVYDTVDRSGDRNLKNKTRRDERKDLINLCYDFCDLITTDTIGARTAIEVLDKVRSVRMTDCAATTTEVNVLAFLTYFRGPVYTLVITDEHWKLEMNRLFYLASGRDGSSAGGRNLDEIATCEMQSFTTSAAVPRRSAGPRRVLRCRFGCSFSTYLLI